MSSQQRTKLFLDFSKTSLKIISCEDEIPEVLGRKQAIILVNKESSISFDKTKGLAINNDVIWKPGQEFLTQKHRRELQLKVDEACKKDKPFPPGVSVDVGMANITGSCTLTF